MRELLGIFPDKTVLAVDGGASKADVALVDVRGNLIGAARRRGSCHFGRAYNGSLDALTEAIKAIRRRGNADSSQAIAALGIFCLAGADIPIDDRRIAAQLERQGWTRKTIVRNDTFAVLRAGTDRKWGVAVVCGTGMNCAGVGPDGRSVRFPSFESCRAIALTAAAGWGAARSARRSAPVTVAARGRCSSDSCPRTSG